MPHKVKVNGSRSLKKGSKKNSKKNSTAKMSKKHSGMDFTSILNDMSGHKTSMANMMGPNMQQGMQMDPNMMMQQGMQMDPNMMMQQGMQMDPNMMMQQGMQMDPSMMMMGKNMKQPQETEIDPLNLQYIVPQNKNMNINNYGISYEQLLNGPQHNALASKFNSGNNAQQNVAQQNVTSVQHKMNSMRI
jgi:hypothetical protein